MKLYLLTRKKGGGHDAYDSVVVCALNEEDAKNIHPNGSTFVEKDYSSSWVIKKQDIECEEIGAANENQERGVILASFNAV